MPAPIIAIDFDGTIVEHAFPEVGKPNPEAIEWMREFKAAGAKLILWTMRSAAPPSPKGPAFKSAGPVSDDPLADAVKYCADNGIVFDAVNEGINDRVWTTSNKCYAHVYIDDAAFGCPVIPDTTTGRPMVNWSAVGPAIMRMIERFNA